MTSTICAARKIQRQEIRPLRYHSCPKCKRALSIAEVIERHCISCERDIQPVDIRETRAA